MTKEFTIPKAKKGDLFLLQFDVENQDTSKDVSVDVEGIRNKLTEKNIFTITKTKPLPIQKF